MIKKKSKKKPSPAQLAARAKFIKAVKSGAFRKKSKGKKKPAKKLAKVSGLTTYIAKKAIQRKLKKQTAPAKISGLKEVSIQNTVNRIESLKKNVLTYKAFIKNKNGNLDTKRKNKAALTYFQQQLRGEKNYLKQLLRNI